MKKKVFCLLTIALLATGCGKIPTLQNGEEAVVTFENGDKISVDELYKEIKDTYALSSLISLVDTYVLEKEFPDYIDTAKDYAENYYKSLESSFDTEEELLEALNDSGISSAEAYKKIIYLNHMQTHASEEYAKAQITEKEIKNYYKNELVSDIELSHILITADTNDEMLDDELDSAEDKAEAQVEDLIKELEKTKKESEELKNEETKTKEKEIKLKE